MHSFCEQLFPAQLHIHITLHARDSACMLLDPPAASQRNLGGSLPSNSTTRTPRFVRRMCAHIASALAHTNSAAPNTHSFALLGTRRYPKMMRTTSRGSNRQVAEAAT